MFCFCFGSWRLPKVITDTTSHLSVFQPSQATLFFSHEQVSIRPVLTFLHFNCPPIFIRPTSLAYHLAPTFRLPYPTHNPGLRSPHHTELLIPVLPLFRISFALGWEHTALDSHHGSVTYVVMSAEADQ
jgi:hypothetical protein